MTEHERSYLNRYLVPVGGICIFAGDASSRLPPGFLVCDGSAVSRTGYSELFSVLSTTFGSGVKSTTFNLPDLEGQLLAGLYFIIRARGNLPMPAGFSAETGMAAARAAHSIPKQGVPT